MEPARRERPLAPDIRVGSSTNALRPISAAERSLAPGTSQWLGLASIAVAAVGADQLTKQVVARTLALGEEVQIAGPFSKIGRASCRGRVEVSGGGGRMRREER